MKIKQVCRKTELTERTIRFYIEKGLIHPNAEEINGRMNYDFSGSDVDMLTDISALRKTGFSIDDIIKIQQFPLKTDVILKAHIDRLKSDSKSLLEVITILDPLRSKSFRGIGELGAAIGKSSAKLPLPAIDIRPNFARFDNITEEEHRKGLADFEAAQKRAYAAGRAIVFTIAAVNILSSIAAAFVQFNLINLIVSFILSGALLAGVSWVRYLFAAGSALSAVIILMLLFEAGGTAGLPAWGIVIMIVYLAFSVASSVVLLVSKEIGEFLYVQKNG